MVSVAGSPRPPGHAVTKGRSPAPALNPAQLTTIPFGRPPTTKPPHISEPDNRNVKAIPLLAKRNPGLARARCVERADFFRKSTPYRKSGLSRQSTLYRQSGLFRKDTPYRKSNSSARAVHWRVRVSVLRDRPGGRPLPLRFFLHSRIKASLFRQNGMAVGLSLWWRLPVPRARTQPRPTHHHSVWPPSDNETPTHFRTRQP